MQPMNMLQNDLLEHPDLEKLPYGPLNDPAESIVSVNNKGVEHVACSQYDEALDCFQSSLCRLDTQLDMTRVVSLSFEKEQPPTVQGSPVNDAYLYHRREYDEGMNSFPAPIRMEGKIMDMLCTQDSAAIILLFNMGQVCLRKQKEVEASECFVRALYLSRILGNRSPVGVVPILHNIGYIQYRSGELENALRTFNDALHIFRFLKNDIELAATMNCIGVVCFHMPLAVTAKAMDYYVEALKIRRQCFGDDHRDVATTLNNIGRVHYIKGEYDYALLKYLEALRIRRRLLGKDHLDVAATVYNAGQTFHQQGELDKALKYYQEFMRITVPKLGQNHRDVAIMLKCMAQIHHEQRKYEHALKLYAEALTVAEDALGVHAEVASILNKMGNLYYERGDFDEALEKYKQGLEVERIVLHGLHPNITVTLTNIGQIHKQRGEYHDALKL
jgi:tetratricopeptide (TPR) repeat protein